MNAGGTLAWTFGNHYASAGGIWYQHILVPAAYGGTNPLSQAVAFGGWSYINSQWTFSGAAYQMNNQAMAFNAAGVGAGLYRVWVHLVPSSSAAQIDAGDNRFPTKYLIRVNNC